MDALTEISACLSEGLSKAKDQAVVAEALSPLLPDVLGSLRDVAVTAESVTTRLRAVELFLGTWARTIRLGARADDAAGRKARAIAKREEAIAQRQAAKNEGVRNQLKVAAERKKFSRVLARAKKEQGEDS